MTINLRTHPNVERTENDTKIINCLVHQIQNDLQVINMEAERLVGGVPVLKCIEPEQQHGDDPAAGEPHQIGNNAEKKQHDD